MKILLKHNSGYRWYKGNNLYFKGYFYKDNELYSGEDAVTFINKEIDNLESLKKLAEVIDGVYCCIISTGNSWLIMVDRARSMPIFFDTHFQYISDSAEEIRKELGINPSDVNPDFYLALYAKSYIFGNFTVYTEIKQLDCGQIAEISEAHTIVLERYYSHKNDIINSLEYDELKNKLRETSFRVFDRLKRTIAGRPVVISLSGGYDSRFVACMLKIIGIEDVSCYTYGKKNSHEVLQSKRNAEALGYRWTCVEYTDLIIKNAFLDDIGLEYLNIIDTHDYTGYLQNYPAVRYLQTHKWFKENSVFITGSCGDMPTGYYIPEEDNRVTYDNEYTANWLYNLIYARQLPDSTFQKEWVKYLISELSNEHIEVTNYQSFVSAIDCVYTKTCHSRCFLHMNRPHDVFGYEWLIPFWDKELLDLFYSIPAKYRYQQKIYEDFLLNDICSSFGIGQKKKVVGYSSNNLKNKLTHDVGAFLVRLCFFFNVPFRRKYDFNNWAPLELELYNRLLCNKTMRWRKAAIVNIFTQYILQLRYGVSEMKRCLKRLKR